MNAIKSEMEKSAREKLHWEKRNENLSKLKTSTNCIARKIIKIDVEYFSHHNGKFSSKKLEFLFVYKNFLLSTFICKSFFFRHSIYFSNVIAGKFF